MIVEELRFLDYRRDLLGLVRYPVALELRNTIEALNLAGVEVLDADDVCAGRVNMNDYGKFVVVFKASELPRAGGGARCMTMPINRS